MNHKTPLDALRYHVTGAIKRGEKEAIVGQPTGSNTDAPKVNSTPKGQAQLTCERCGLKTDAGAWIGFVYVGAECLTKEDEEYLE